MVLRGEICVEVALLFFHWKIDSMAYAYVIKQSVDVTLPKPGQCRVDWSASPTELLLQIDEK